MDKPRYDTLLETKVLYNKALKYLRLAEVALSDGYEENPTNYKAHAAKQHITHAIGHIDTALENMMSPDDSTRKWYIELQKCNTGELDDYWIKEKSITQISFKKEMSRIL